METLGNCCGCKCDVKPRQYKQRKTTEIVVVWTMVLNLSRREMETWKRLWLEL